MSTTAPEGAAPAVAAAESAGATESPGVPESAISDTRLANEAWQAMMTAHARLVRMFSTEGVFSELSMREYDVLYALRQAGGPLRLRELRSEVLLSQPALSRLVDRLVARGLVARCGDPADGRAVQLSLTEAGRQAQRRVGRGHAASVARELTASLTREQLHLLRDLAGAVAEGSTPGESGPEVLARDLAGPGQADPNQAGADRTSPDQTQTGKSEE